MKPRLSLYWIFAFLMIAGISLTFIRHHVMDIPLKPRAQTALWTVEARVDFAANQQPVMVSLSIPENPPGYRLFSEQAASPGYGFSFVNNTFGRRAEWSRRREDGPQRLYYKIQVIPETDSAQLITEEQPPIQPVFWEGSEVAAAHALVATAQRRSSNPETLARQLVQSLNRSDTDQNAALLSNKYSREELLGKLLADAAIPSRIVQGLLLEDQRRNQSLTPMLDIYNGKAWILIDPHTGQRDIPENYLLWHRGGPSILDLTGGTAGKVSFTMLSQTVSALEMARIESSDHLFSFLSMHHLPLDTQGVFRLLLLLPIGALVVVFMRIVIGIRTSGTFMPVLIALAFFQTSPVSGVFYFLIVVTIGLILRSYLSHLNLLLVARISTIVIIVITLVALFSLTAIRLGLETTLPATSFPIIIIAWTIERMSILWEEEGMQEVAIQGFGSLFVAFCAYILMRMPLVGHLSFNFPELNLVVAAIIMIMGQYTGYRLLELRRFAVFREDAS
jgi:hypothetical protein